jgi:5'-3' exonuclease
LHVLAPEEDGRMRAQTEEYVRRRAHATKPEERVEFYPILPENKAPVAHAILAAKGAGTWRGLYYSHLFDGAAVPEACRAYLTGLAWTLRYYKRKAKDGRWTYPHGFAPTIRDLADAAQAGLAELAGLGAAWEAAGASAAGFVSTDVQLLSILPIKSRALLPKRLQPFMTDPAFGCAHLYPRTFRLQTFMKTRLWECVPVLPPLDVAWIENAVAAAKGV